jgi:hypothetical protein
MQLNIRTVRAYVCSNDLVPWREKGNAGNVNESLGNAMNSA